MTYFVQPKYGAEIRNYNLVVGYHNDKAIVKNEDNLFFFIECEEHCAPQGTVVENQAITPITELPEAEQKEIISIYTLED